MVWVALPVAKRCRGRPQPRSSARQRTSSNPYAVTANPSCLASVESWNARQVFLGLGTTSRRERPGTGDTIGKIVTIEGFFVELEILNVNGQDIEQDCAALSSLDELELRGTVFFKTLEAAKDHYKTVLADSARQEAGKHGRGNKVIDFGLPRPKRR
jgi:hypothetical protein